MLSYLSRAEKFSSVDLVCKLNYSWLCRYTHTRTCRERFADFNCCTTCGQF